MAAAQTTGHQQLFTAAKQKCLHVHLTESNVGMTSCANLGFSSATG